MDAFPFTATSTHQPTSSHEPITQHESVCDSGCSTPKHACHHSLHHAAHHHLSNWIAKHTTTTHTPQAWAHMTIIAAFHSSGCCQQSTSSVCHSGNPSFLPHMHTVYGVGAMHVLRVELAGDTTTTNVTSLIATAVPQVLLDNTAVCHCKDMPPRHTMHCLTTHMTSQQWFTGGAITHQHWHKRQPSHFAPMPERWHNTTNTT